MPVVLLLAGAACFVVGAALITWQAGLAALGLVLIGAGVDLASGDRG